MQDMLCLRSAASTEFQQRKVGSFDIEAVLRDADRGHFEAKTQRLSEASALSLEAPDGGCSDLSRGSKRSADPVCIRVGCR
jgi:hypothetical protein